MTEQNTTTNHVYPGLNDWPPSENARPPKAPKKKWFRRPAVLLTVFGLGCALVGGGIGASGKPEPVTVTKEVPGPERVVTKTETKEVEVTPQSCLTALDLAEQGFDYASEAMGYMSAAMTAAGNIDLAGVQQASADLKTVTPKMEALAPKANAAKAECRAAGS
jgi:hypothetical protein